VTIPNAIVVNIALPHIQTGLHFSATSLSWVMNGYTLTFGGLLLLGGRAGDILGRRRMFFAGITVFTLASLAGGLATSSGLLLVAWAIQGVGGALASPAVLALVVSAFPEGRERTRALGIYAGVVTGGSSGSFVARLLLVAGMFGMFFFLTQFIQDVLGFSPLRAGVAFLPMTIMLFAVSRTAPRLMPVFGPKPLMIAGMIPVIAGMAWLSRVSPATGYWTGVFGPMTLFGLGMGVVFVPLTTVSLAGVRPEDSGAASSMVNVMQQVGGSLGLAVLVAVFGTAYRDAAGHPVPGLSAVAEQHHVLSHGMSTAFGLAAIFDVVTLALIVVLLKGRTPRPAVASASPAADDQQRDRVRVPDTAEVHELDE
jgi:MFS family permease